MTQSIWDTIANTPWWVYVIFIFLLRAGLSATKPRTVPLRSFFVLPAILIPLSLINFFIDVNLTPTNVGMWLGALLVGILLGKVQFRLLRIKAIPKEAKLHVPGSWSLLIVLLVIFLTRYYYGHEMAIDPDVLKQPKWMMAMFLAYGFFTGLFIGRAISAVRCVKSGPFVATA